MGSEVQFQFGKIYIPESTEKAYVYHERKLRGKPLAKDPSKEIHHAGIWKYDNDIAALQQTQLEVWVFFYDKLGNIPKDVPEHVLENNPNQGFVGYDKHDLEKHLDWKTRATPKQMWFYPPKYKAEDDDDVMVKGIWIKPEFKRDLSDLEPNKNGFLNVTGKNPLHKGGRLGVGGGWKMLAIRDQVKKKKKSGDDNENDKNAKWTINVRTPNGTTFPIKVIPGNNIFNVKEKIALNKKPLISIPPEEQRLFFLKDPKTDIRCDRTQLHDDKTLVGSGVRNGDTIDLGPMAIYVRNPKGKKFKLDVDPVEKIEKVMDLVHENEGTPVPKQVLFYKRVRLRPNGKNDLSTYKIKHKDTIDLMPMIIYVETFDGTTIELEVEPTYPLELVKKRTKTRTQIPIEEQTLYFEKKFMDSDSKLLRDYNVEHKDTLVMKREGPRVKPTPAKKVTAAAPKKKGDMLIFVVKDWNNEKFTLDDGITPKTTILQVKTMIEQLQDIPIDKQRLTFKNKSVYNTKTLEQSKIKDRNVLHLEAKKVNIKVPSGDVYSLDVNPNEPIRNLLERMEPETNAPADKQKLTFNNDTLDPARTLDDYKVPHNAPLNISVEEPEPKFEVELPDGSRVPIDDPINKTIDDIKDMLEPITKVPRDMQRVFYLDDDDDSLPGDLPLSKSKIPDGGTIKLAPPTIIVNTPDGKNRNFMFDPEDPVKDVEKKVNKKYNLPADTRLLSPLGDELDPDEPLLDQITPNQVMQMLPPEIPVELPGGGKVMVPVNPKDTIDDVKGVIADATGIPAPFQRIFYIDPDDDRELPGDTPIIETQLNKGKSIQVAPPTIEVRDPDGKVRNFVLDPDDSLNDIQPKVAKKFGLPLSTRILPDGADVDPDAPFLDQISPGTVLVVAPPELEVDVPGVGKVKFPIDSKQTVGDLRDMIQDGLGIPKAFQRIFYMDDEKEPLSDETPLSHIESKPEGGPLQLRQPEIMVVGPDGNPRSFVLDYDDTVADLEEKVRKKLNFPLNHRLFRDDDPIDEQEPLSKCVSHGDVLTPAEPIDIEIEGKGKVKIPLTHARSMGDIPDIIAGMTGIPASRLRNFHWDNEMDSPSKDTPLSKVDSKPNRGPLLIQAPEIQVMGRNGPRTFVWDFDESEDEFKTKIKKKLGIPLDQRLFRENDYKDIDDPVLEDCLSHGDVLLMEPPLEVDILGKGKEYISILPTQNVGELKALVEEKTGIPRSRQRLFHFDNDTEELDDSSPLAHAGIKPGDGPLQIRPPEVQVKTVDGVRTFVMDFDDDTTEVANKIRKNLNIPLNQRIFRDGDYADIDDPKLEYALSHGDILVADSPGVEIDLPGKGKQFVNVLPTQTMREIKGVVEEKTGIPSARMRVFHMNNHDDELDDDLPVSKSELKPGDMLQILPPEVQVVTDAGIRTFIMDFDENVEDFAKKVKKKLNFSLDQRLFRDGEEILVDDPELERALTHGDVITLEPSELEIDIAGKGKISLQFLPTQTMGEIKSIIEEELGIRSNRMRIFHLDNDTDELDDSTPLSKAGIKPGAVLQMKPPEITVQEPNSKMSRTFVLDFDEDIEEFAKKVSHKLGFPLHQRLFRDGQYEDIDDLDLEQSLTHGDVLTLAPSELEIDIPGRGKVTLQFLPTMTMAEVKEIIEEEVHIPKSQMGRIFHLEHVDEELDDDMPLSKTLVKAGTTLQMLPPEFVVETKVGKSPRTFVMDMNESVDDFRKRVEAKTGEKFTPDLFLTKLWDLNLPDDPELSESDYSEEDGIYHIQVMHWSGEVFSLPEITGEHFVADVEQQILEEKQIPRDQQQLTFRGKALDRTKSLKEQGIPHNSILVMEEGREVEVALPKRKKFKLTVFPTTTMTDVKRVIEEEIPDFTTSEKQRLFVMDNDDELDDDIPFKKLKFDAGTKFEIRPFVLLIVRHNGEKFTVDSKPEEYIEDVMETIEFLKGIPVHRQRLRFEDEAVNETLSLKDQNIVHESTLYLEPMQIRVAMPNDPGGGWSIRRELKFVVELDYTVEKIKNILSESVEIEDKCLVFAGEELRDDEKSLVECEIENDDLLSLEYFEIRFVHWNGNEIVMSEIRPKDETMAEIKQRLVSLVDVSIEQLWITFNGRPTQDDQTLHDQHVSHKSRLVLEPPNDSGISNPTGERMVVGKTSGPTIQNRAIDEDDIWPDVPDWSRRFFFFDNDVSLDSLIEISIIHWDGDTFSFKDVRLSETVDGVKERIAKLRNIKAAQFRLKADGKTLKGDMSLLAQKIHHKSFLTMDQVERRQIDRAPSADKVGFKVMAAKASFSKMKVTIKNWKGDSFKLDCDPLEYIDDVKERIEMLKKIPVDDQRLSFEGSIVDDTLTLKEQKIVHKSTLCLEPMQIHVQLISHGGKQLSFPVEPEYTIAMIKDLIAKETTLKMDDKSLMFAGDELMDDMTLSECSIDHDDILTLERFAISVLHWSGEVWPVENVNPNGTIAHVIQKIRKLKQLEADLHLSFQFMPIDDNKTLREQGIKYKSILVLADAHKMSLPGSPRVTREKVSLAAFSTSDLGQKAEKRKLINVERLTLIVQGAKEGTFTVEMEPTEYLDDIRDKIFKLKSIPVELQRLSFQGRPVNESSTLIEQNIGHQSTLVLEPMKVHIKVMPHGKQLSFAVEPEDTLGKVKEMIAKKTAVPLDDRCLLLGGEELKDDQTLAECGIEHDEVITMERFAVNVMHWSGEVILFENVKQTGTIGHVKEKIRRKFGNLAPSKQELYFEGKYIDDEKTLQQQGVKYKSVLVLEEAGPQGSKSPFRDQKISLSQSSELVDSPATQSMPQSESQGVPGTAQNAQLLSAMDNNIATTAESVDDIKQVASSKKEQSLAPPKKAKKPPTPPPESAFTPQDVTKRYDGSRLTKKTPVDNNDDEKVAVKKKHFVNNPKMKLDSTTKRSGPVEDLTREEERIRVKLSLLALSQDSPEDSPDESPVADAQKPKKSFEVKLPKKKPKKEKPKKEKKPSSVRRIKFTKSPTKKKADNNASTSSLISSSDDSSISVEKKKKQTTAKNSNASTEEAQKLASRNKDPDGTTKTPKKKSKPKATSNSKRIKFTPTSPPKTSKKKLNIE